MVTHWQFQKILILTQHKGLEFPRWPGEGGGVGSVNPNLKQLKKSMKLTDCNFQSGRGSYKNIPSIQCVTITDIQVLLQTVPFLPSSRDAPVINTLACMPDFVP